MHGVYKPSDVNKRIPVSTLEAKHRIKNFKEVNLGFTPEEAEMEAARCVKCRNPKCVPTCPAHLPVPEYISAVKEGDFTKALDIIANVHPFVHVCGRVCPHKCEYNCIRSKKGQALSIMLLKRSAADFGSRNDITCTPPTGKRIAVVGSGPAGLTAAYKLARYGHKVVIYEQKSQIGGMMALCIPPYRLPRAALLEDASRVLNLGCEVRLNKKITDLEKLRAKYDAVFLGLGTMKPKHLNIPGDHSIGVEHVIPFLESVNLRGRYNIGKNVAVIGAGFSALDAVRVARRLGSEATIIYRRTRSEMPATQDEVVEAEEEGVEMLTLVTPLEVLTNSEGKVTGLKLQRQELGEPDESGRPSPKPIPGSEFVFKCDMVIEAISQVTDLTDFPTLPTTKWGTLDVDEHFMVKGHQNVYATGDCVTGPKSIIEGVADAFKCVDFIQESFGLEVPKLEIKRE